MFFVPRLPRCKSVKRARAHAQIACVTVRAKSCILLITTSALLLVQRHFADSTFNKNSTVSTTKIRKEQWERSQPRARLEDGNTDCISIISPFSVHLIIDFPLARAYTNPMILTVWTSAHYRSKERLLGCRWRSEVTGEYHWTFLGGSGMLSVRGVRLSSRV